MSTEVTDPEFMTASRADKTTKKSKKKDKKKDKKKRKKDDKKAKKRDEKPNKKKDKPKKDEADNAHHHGDAQRLKDDRSAKAERKLRKEQRRRAEVLPVHHRPQAEREDRHDLYQRSVQDCAADMDFLVRAHRDVYGAAARPLRFREDFCGTAAMCAEWVRRGLDHHAEGFDIDPECLQWGREHNLVPIGDAAQRIALHQRDVREHGDAPADIRCAHNFSYQVFERRADLADYFRAARAGLGDQSIFVLDLYGGSESFTEIEEEREIEDGAFTYVWEQRSFHPATGRTECFIHFRFPDGSALPEAFSYTWRLYTPPELRDLLLEVGFREVRTYFEEFDEEGDGNGHFARDEQGPACEGWLGYMVAVP